jgi:hypothetical protein
LILLGGGDFPNAKHIQHATLHRFSRKTDIEPFRARIRFRVSREQSISKSPRRVFKANAIMDREDEAVADMDEELHVFKEPKWDVIEE